MPRKLRKVQKSFKPRWIILTLPVSFATVFLFTSLILFGVLNKLDDIQEIYSLTLGITGLLYTLIYFFLIHPYPIRFTRWKWLIAVFNAIALSLFDYFLPAELKTVTNALIILTTIVSVIEFDTWPTFIFLAITFIIHQLDTDHRFEIPIILADIGPYLLAVVILEIVASLQTTNRQYVKRLEVINNLARSIASSLETAEVIKLIHSAVQQTLNADIYQIALLDEDHFDISLFQDEGDFYTNQTSPVEGSLSGWIIRNKQSLLIHDLPNAKLDYAVLGQDKNTLSWMGAPIYNEENIIGVIAVASHQKNSFEVLDLELLENLAQQASTTLHNARHHAEVEAQTHLDSLTGVCTHGYFLEMLQLEADRAVQGKTALSLIMLDIDYFKQYNDSFGHLVGDQVLTTLITAIHGHIKNSDYIGRWGGEEFAILLPNASGSQANLVAERISETINKLTVVDREGRKITLPTISQGIAMFPDEADEIFKLIDIADQRLYVAKERGRNQIEPNASHWERLKT